MRLWPRSMVGRTSLVLFAGMVVILCLGAMVWSLSVFGGGGPPRNVRLMERIATLVVLIDHAPPAARGDMLKILRAPGFRATWSPRRRPDRLVSRDWFTSRMERRLRHALRHRGIDTVVVGHTSDAERGRALIHAGAVRVRLRLGDGS